MNVEKEIDNFRLVKVMRVNVHVKKSIESAAAPGADAICELSQHLTLNTRKQKSLRESDLHFPEGFLWSKEIGAINYFRR
ncbi:hypothetical protein FITA111629_02705 [Filibacter tadaridae]|uniref:Uncharacterized protein n=1 Tax=Filibacter tadaridae TaxID=2483811 RepID=A0A3P5XPR7_9BACL|nr:hypothetical protein [Filibacter tadaridae]VDC29835.1 hypothetical protein FILTAD_02387 [Filibacter tadaridae]